jgi:hypothetical protein
MASETFHFSPALSELTFDYRQVIPDAGFRDEASAGEFIPQLEAIDRKIRTNLDIEAGFAIVGEVAVKAGTIEGAGFTLKCGRIITSQLRHVRMLATFLCTLGGRIDDWARTVFDENPAEGLFVDLLASIIAESTAEWLERKIVDVAANRGMRCTNRYSPGYCEWDVSEQKTLFRLFPERFCHVMLTESSLMVPRKSVSGIIGLGENVVRQEYDCEVCTQENCFRNRER